jgi:hypothetical protein
MSNHGVYDSWTAVNKTLYGIATASGFEMEQIMFGMAVFGGEKNARR